MNWKMLLFFVSPILNQVSTMLANKDADDTGADDTTARVLHWMALAIQAIVADQPIPPMSPSLVKELK